MTKDNPMTRRDFTLQSVLAILSGVTITIVGCSDSGNGSNSPTAPTSPEPAPTPSSPPTGNVTGTISANHGHEAVITRAELTAGNAVELDIMGTADHTHTVSLSAQQVDQIAMGARVSRTSTTEQGHAHSVTFN
jgi:hypothetical protein